MTIYDLSWHPSLTEPAFVATHRFDDGIIAWIKSEDGATFRLTVGERSRGVRVHEALDRTRANNLLTLYAKQHSL